MPPLEPDPPTVDDDAPTHERSIATTLPDPGRAGAHTGIASAYAYLSLRAKFFAEEPQTRLTVAGRYTLLEKLGEGAMGVVFAAFDGKLGRKVALKVVRSFGDADARARLLREAQSLAQLSDPNVVQVHEVDEYRGEVYVAMELIEGVPLGAWIAANKPGFAALFEVLLAAGRGLAAAHRRGVIHRDIKPANILVGADGRARVADFGLAWVDGDREGTATAPQGSMASTLPSVMSQSGAGTPAYMSPEQIGQQQLDARSDLFGFCVVVWEAVYGAHPFPADTAEQVALRICEGTVAPPPRPRGVPLRLEKILRKGLAVRRDQRHADMATLLAELERLRRPWTRTRMILAAGLGAGLAFGGAQMVGLCRDVTRELDAVWTDEVEAELRASLSPALAGQLAQHVERLRAGRTAMCDRYADGELAEAWYRRAQECFAEREQRLATVVGALRERPERAAAMTAADVAGALGEAARCSEAAYVKAAVEPPEEAASGKVAEIAARRRQGDLMLLDGDFRAAAQIFADAVAEAREVGHAPTTSAALFDLGRTLLRLRRGEAATAALHEAQVLADGARDAHAAADASLLLVDAAVAGNRLREAQWHVDETLARLRAAGRDRGGPLGELELARVDLLVRQGRPEEAEQALATASSLLQADPLEGGLWRYNSPKLAARVAELRGDRDAVKQWSMEARAALAGLVGGDGHPLYLEEVGRAARLAGELDEAHEQLLAARAIYAEAIGPDSVHVAAVDVELAKVHRDRGQFEAAAAAARHADAILGLCPAEPMTLDDCVALAGLLVQQAMAKGDFAEALKQYERGLAALEKFDVGVQAVNVARLAASSADLMVQVEEVRDVPRARARIDQALALLRAGGALFTAADSLPILRIAADVALAAGDSAEARRLVGEVRGLLTGQADPETEARIDFIEARLLGADDPAGRRLAQRALEFQRAAGRAADVAEIEAWLAGAK